MKQLLGLLLIVSLVLLAGCQVEPQSKEETLTPLSTGDVEDAMAIQEVIIKLYDGKMDTDVVMVKKDIPVLMEISNLNNDFNETTFVINAFEIQEEVPKGKVSVIEFTPNKAGSFEYGLEKSVVKGVLVVE